MMGIKSVLCLAFECPGRSYLPGHATNESSHAVQFDLSSGGDLLYLRQEYLLGGQVAGMLLMPLGVFGLNLFPKVRVEASDKLACAVHWKHLLVHEELDCRPK